MLGLASFSGSYCWYCYIFILPHWCLKTHESWDLFCSNHKNLFCYLPVCDFLFSLTSINKRPRKQVIDLYILNSSYPYFDTKTNLMPTIPMYWRVFFSSEEHYMLIGFFGGTVDMMVVINQYRFCYIPIVVMLLWLF